MFFHLIPFSAAIFCEIDVLVLDAEVVESERCLIIDLCLDASPVICVLLVLNVSNIDNLGLSSINNYYASHTLEPIFDNIIYSFYVIIIIYINISIYILFIFYILILKYIHLAILINEISKP
jgi:hypothetical protein